MDFKTKVTIFTQKVLVSTILYFILGGVGFPDGSADEESTCNAVDLSLILGSGKSAGEGIGHPLQYSWASFMAQLVKNWLATQDIWVPSLGWEDPLEKGNATHSSILV